MLFEKNVLTRWRILLMLPFVFVARAYADPAPPADGVVKEDAPPVAQPASMPAAKAKDNIEEVVVSARKRPEKLLETPISMTVLNAETMHERGIVSLPDVAEYSPNVEINENGSSGAGGTLQLFIRGMGQLDFISTTDPGVGTYVDGIYIPRPYASLLRLPDIDQVEVLRGPQGTLFGKNTTGGAVSLTTVKPNNDTRVQAELATGSFHLIDGSAFVNAPMITDRLLATFAFAGTSQDGYTTNPFLPQRHLGDQGVVAGRAQFLGIITDNFHTQLSVDYTFQRRDGLPTRLVYTNPGAPAASLYNLLVVPHGGQLWNQSLVDNKPWTETSTGPAQDNMEGWGLGLTNTWYINPRITLTSLTAYRNYNTFTATDLDASQINYASLTDATARQNVSEEMRLNGKIERAKIDWVLGAYYYYELSNEDEDPTLAPGTYAALQAFPGPLDGSPLSAPTAPGGPGNPINKELNFQLHEILHQTTNSAAGFVDATYHLTDVFRFSGGFRYTEDFKRLDVVGSFTDTTGYSIPPTAKTNSWAGFSGRAGAEQLWLKNLMTYVSYSHGFKAGGFNGRPLSVNDIEAYSPEDVDSIEIGLKVQTWQRRLQLSAAAFYNDYRNIQETANITDAQGHFGVLVANAGHARIDGGELEALLRPVTGLIINGTLGYLDAAYLSLDKANELGITLNTPLPKIPTLSVNAGAQYTLFINRKISLVGRVDFSFKSKYYNEVNGSNFTATQATGLLGARLAAELFDGRYELALSGTNLTNQYYALNGITVSAFGAATVNDAPPREWRLSGAVRF